MIKKYNILIVDDVLMNRVLIRELVLDICENIYEAKDGKEAIEILNKTTPDIIMMDIEMPVMNGLETTKYIRTEMPKHISELPIIALTAHNPNDFFEDFSSVGFDDLLTKPYSFQKVMNAIQSIEK